MILCYWRKSRKPKNNLPPYGKYETAAGCQSFAAVSGSDGNAFAEKSIETVNSLTLSFVSAMAAIPLVAKRRLAQLVEHLSYTQ